MKGEKESAAYTRFIHLLSSSPSLPSSLRIEEQIRPIPFLPVIDEAIDATIEPASPAHSHLTPFSFPSSLPHLSETKSKSAPSPSSPRSTKPSKRPSCPSPPSE